ncbi:MAG TPA: type II toxin-antitoxin system RelE/ParE family toxin [Patescibacteria group bacterium]|jgi:mRNA interferase RelE/StbE|nr:type II toxin-antitoxin system RelE/ParE family toxin [Patescibacteria group bacterium]
MNNYVIEFTKSAQKELYKLPHSASLRLAKAIKELGIDPRKGNVRPMVGSKSWRLRVGDYRVIYDILDNKLVVLIIRIRYRKDVYR